MQKQESLEVLMVTIDTTSMSTVWLVKHKNLKSKGVRGDNVESMTL